MGGPTWPQWLRAGLVGFVLLVCLVGILILAFDVTRRIENGATAPGDAPQWTISQIDVELLALDVAVHDAISPVGLIRPLKDRLAEVRKRFDIFYSRIHTLGNGQVFVTMRKNQDFEQNYERLVAFLDAVAPLMDGPDIALTLALPTLHEQLTVLRPQSRVMSLAGLRAFAASSQQDRRQVENTLLMMAALSIVFIVTMLAMVIVLLRLDAANRARRAEVEVGTARLAAIVGTAQDAVITLDVTGRILDANPAAQVIFGYRPADLVGGNLDDMLFPMDYAAVHRAMAQALTPTEGASGPNRLRVPAKDLSGRQFPVELTVTATRDGPRLLVATMRDLTAEVAAEADLVKARDTALAGERAKADLLAVMSHEVRTPLNGLLGTLELLGRTKLTAQQSDYLRILDTSGSLLLHHVNDVLDISRLDSGLMRMNAAPLDLGTLARQVLENQAAAAAARGNLVTLTLPQDGRLGVVADAQLLAQVLLNLLGNAVKFTEAGKITLSIRHLGPEGPTMFSVADDGIGIPAQDLPRVFDDFVTLDPSYGRQAGGTGLGLGIARRIVGQLGGSLAVESIAGKGSRFYFTLALPILPAGEISRAEVIPPLPVKAGASLDVLVVEDNMINRLVLREMLGGLGHRVTEASDGTIGLALAAGQAFDVILMDISMPGIDGLQATAQLRAGPGMNQATPVVALTAHALPEEQARFRAGGMVDVLIKPFSARDLAAVLQHATLGIKPAQTAKPKPRRAVARVPKSLAHLVPDFVKEGSRDVAAILDLAQRDPSSEDLRRVVHRLAGSAGLIGATGMARKLSRLETAIKLGNARQVHAEINGLSALWAQTAQDLQRISPGKVPLSAGTA